MAQNREQLNKRYSEEGTRAREILINGAKTGDLAIVKSIIENDEVEVIDEYNAEIALSNASEYGHIEIVKYIINTIGVIENLHVRSFDGALLAASKKGHIEIVKYLIDYSPKEHYPIYMINSATAKAAEYGYLDIVKYFVNEKGANVQIDGKLYPWANNPKALMESICNGHLEIVKFLLTKIPITDDILKYSLHKAIEKLQIDIVKYFVEEIEGCVAIIHDSFERVQSEWALHYAIMASSLELIKYFISKDCNIHNEDNIILTRVIRTGRMDIIRYFIEPAPEGLNIGLDGIRANNNYAIQNALEYGYSEVIDYLIEKGITYDEIFIAAACYGCNELIKRYIKDGLITVGSLELALQKASKYGNWQTVKFLIKSGAYVNADNDEALRMAAENGHLPIVKVLVKAGANIHVNNDVLLNAIYTRKYVKKNKVVEYLKSLRV